MAQKTLAYLKSRFETGDIPTGQDYENLLDSFWHKSNLGSVASGDQRPVTGGAVYEAITRLLGHDAIKAIVTEVLQELLPTLLADYVTGTALATALSGKATEAWVSQQLASYATTTAVNTALADKANLSAVYTKEAADLQNDTVVQNEQSNVTEDDELIRKLRPFFNPTLLPLPPLYLGLTFALIVKHLRKKDA